MYEKKNFATPVFPRLPRLTMFIPVYPRVTLSGHALLRFPSLHQCIQAFLVCPCLPAFHPVHPYFTPLCPGHRVLPRFRYPCFSPVIHNFSSTHVLICVKEATPLVGYCSWINSMPKIRASYMQALKLTLVFASLLFEAEKNLETPDSSVFVDQGVAAFPRNRRYIYIYPHVSQNSYISYILMFLRTS